MHLGLDDQALGVHEQVALATLYFLAAVIASGSHFSVVLVDWLSIIPALGVASLSILTLSRWRRMRFSSSHRPSIRQRRK